MFNLKIKIMKLFINVVALLGVITASYSQNLEAADEFRSDELPTVVIKSAGKDFSVYLPDKNPDSKVRQMQENFIGYNLGKDFEGYDEYLVMMETDDAYLTATYNQNGKLIRVVEKYENVKLPKSVVLSVYKAFPEWTIVKDKFLYAQEDGTVKNKSYSLKLKKDNETKKIVVNPQGKILAGL